VKIRDIIHLYLGCEVQVTWEDGDIQTYKLQSVHDHGFIFGQNIDPKAKHKDFEFELDWLDEPRPKVKLQLVLHHVHDLPEDNLKQYYRLTKKIATSLECVTVDTPESLHFLLKNYVDAFDLIEKKLAIRPADRYNGERKICISCEAQLPISRFRKNKVTYFSKRRQESVTKEYTKSKCMTCENAISYKRKLQSKSI